MNGYYHFYINSEEPLVKQLRRMVHKHPEMVILLDLQGQVLESSRSASLYTLQLATDGYLPLTEHIQTSLNTGPLRFAWTVGDLSCELTLSPFRGHHNEQYILASLENILGAEKYLPPAETAPTVTHQPEARLDLELIPLPCCLVDQDLILYETNQLDLAFFRCENKEMLITNFAQMFPLYQPNGEPSLEAAKVAVARCLAGETVEIGWIFKDNHDENIPSQIVLVKLNDTQVLVYKHDLRRLNEYYVLKRQLDAVIYDDESSGSRTGQYFIEQVTQWMKWYQIGQVRRFEILLIKINHFERILAEHGQDIADKVLKITASRIDYVVPEGSFVSRLKGEIFGTIAEEVIIEAVADRITKNIKGRTFSVDGIKLPVTVTTKALVLPVSPKELETYLMSRLEDM